MDAFIQRMLWHFATIGKDTYRYDFTKLTLNLLVSSKKDLFCITFTCSFALVELFICPVILDILTVPIYDCISHSPAQETQFQKANISYFQNSNRSCFQTQNSRYCWKHICVNSHMFWIEHMFILSVVFNRMDVSNFNGTCVIYC